MQLFFRWCSAQVCGQACSQTEDIFLRPGFLLQWQDVSQQDRASSVRGCPGAAQVLVNDSQGQELHQESDNWRHREYHRGVWPNSAFSSRCQEVGKIFYWIQKSCAKIQLFKVWVLSLLGPQQVVIILATHGLMWVLLGLTQVTYWWSFDHAVITISE